MIKITTAVLTVCLSLFLAGCPARPRPLSQPETIVAEGAYVHEKSGMTLPLVVGDYRRTEVIHVIMPIISECERNGKDTTS